MDLNYAIFRSEPINNLNDLAQIGAHNKREKKAYNSNPDIDITKSKDNIEIVPLTDKNVVADELLFTASNKFFQNMTTDDIKEWANTCMEFVYNDLGYTKDQVLVLI